MATILVDYENVQGFQGLKGVEYLNESDRLIIYRGIKGLILFLISSA